MRIMMLGASHHGVNVDLREKLALSGEALERAIGDFRQRFPSAQLVVLSTCNRIELYVARPSVDEPDADQVRQLLADHCGATLEQVTEATVNRENDQAVLHLFRVATGLDSMVLGEPQILGQIKRAYEYAQQQGTVDKALHRIFQQAIATAKQVRTDTGIDEGRVSVGSVAVDFAHQIFEHFEDKTIVGIGAGEMAKLTLRHLLRLNPKQIWLVNRSLDKAKALTDQLGITGSRGGARPFDAIDETLIEADIVLTSTGATEPIITAKKFKPLLRKRKLRPLCIIDIAVPRDVETRVGSMSNVYLYNIDDLRKVVDQTRDDRSAQIEQCEQMLFEAVGGCMYQIQHNDVGHLIKQLRKRLHDMGEIEHDRTLKKLAASDPQNMSDVLEEHTQRLINKILHMPLSQLDDRNTEAPLGFYAAALRRLFQLDEDASVPPEKTDEKNSTESSPEISEHVSPNIPRG